MKVFVDHDSGFCGGVVKAIQLAEKENDGHLYCLGEIVHNQAEIDRLAKNGVKFISLDEFKNLKNARVLIRAHGEPPETYNIAEKNNIEIVDASCKIVLKLQEKVKKAAEDMEAKSGQIVIFGKASHPEVIGLVGQSKAKIIVIDSLDEIDQIDFRKPIRLFSQTTRSLHEYGQIKQMIKSRAVQNNTSENIDFKAVDSICRQVSNREGKLAIFAQKHDVIVFVGGKKSSNAKFLFGICKKYNPKAYFVSDSPEIKKDWFEGAETVGICGATSTPQWLMNKVAKEIEKY